MDKIQLTATITEVVAFVILIAKLLLGVDLLTEGEIAEVGGAVAIIVVLGYQVWTKMAQRAAEIRADKAEQSLYEANKDLAKAERDLEITQRKLDRALLAQ